MHDSGLAQWNKHNLVQAIMTILIDQNGIPIDYELFHGKANVSEPLSLFLNHMTEALASAELMEILLPNGQTLHAKARA